MFLVYLVHIRFILLLLWDIHLRIPLLAGFCLYCGVLVPWSVPWHLFVCFASFSHFLLVCTFSFLHYLSSPNVQVTAESNAMDVTYICFLYPIVVQVMIVIEHVFLIISQWVICTLDLKCSSLVLMRIIQSILFPATCIILSFIQVCTWFVLLPHARVFVRKAKVMFSQCLSFCPQGRGHPSPRWSCLR